VTRKSGVADENRAAWGDAQGYFFRYEAPYQFSADSHGVQIGDLRIGR
jgi:hypothetical protein